MGNIPGVWIPIIAIIAAATIAIFAPLVRAYGRRLERQASPTMANQDIAARLERMEHAIESIAIEIERVSEGQRFTTKLLAERPDAVRIERGGQTH